MKLVTFLLGILMPIIVNGDACGIRPALKNYLIVRGQNAKAEHWPWHATVYHQQSLIKPPEYVCGGSLIHKKFVLTAQHCTVSTETGQALNGKVIKVQFGLQQLYKWSPQMQEHYVLNVHRVKDKSFAELNNDIALLELQTEVQFNDYVRPICLPEKDVKTDDYGTVVGFGFTEDDSISSILKEASMPVIAIGKCIRADRVAYGGLLDEGVFCAGYQNGTTVCNGDSGGGLAFDRGNSWQLGGVVSFAVEHESGNGRCRQDSYGAFTNVFTYLEWIRRILQRSDGGPWRKLPRDCGRHLVSRVKGGSDAGWLEFPWMAQLRWEDSKERYVFCLGSLISKRYILSSSLCTSKAYHTIFVELGDYDRAKNPDCNINDSEDCVPPVRVYEVESYAVHTIYLFAFYADIALFRLSEDVLFDDHIQPICLPVSKALRELKLNEYIVSGWGNAKQIDGKPSDILQKATLQFMEKDECVKRHEYEFQYYNTTCASGRNGTAYTLLEDVGAPIGYPVRNNGIIRFTQFGIQSLGGENWPTVFTDVGDYMDWVLDNIKP